MLKQTLLKRTLLNRFTLAASMTALATLTLLAGCSTVGPNFNAPPASVPGPAAYRHVDAGVENGAVALPGQWWTVFGDAALDGLEQRALHDNPNVRAAAERLLQAQAQLGLVHAADVPSINLGASAANARTSQSTSQGKAFGGRSIHGNQYAVVGSLSYEADLWGKMKRVAEAADAQALAAAYDRDGVLLLLSSQVATTYWQLRGLNAELAILRDSLASRHETQQLVEDRFRGGFSNELDVARAQVESANAAADLHEAERQRNLLEHGLAALIGASPSSPMAAASAQLGEPPLIPSGLPANLLAQRPDLAESVANLRAANAQIGVAESAFYPSLQLTGSYGYASESLQQVAQGSSRQFSIGPLALSLPIFDGGRNRANLALARARYDEALANHQLKLVTALREVEDALSDTEQRQKQGVAQALAQQAATRAYAVARKRYEHGVSNYLDVTDAQRSSLAADRAAVQIRTQRFLAATAVARSLGGGWQADHPLLAVTGAAR
jgi:NodT family efflux transporter outer membrane factor (OMF) lipoprotein